MAWAMIILPLTSLLSVAITVPLSGALVRWRMHYNPRRIQLPDAETQQISDSPVTGYFSTLRRVYRLEGWSGLYKGFSPTFFGAVIIASMMLAWLQIDPTLGLRIPGRVSNMGYFGRVFEGVLGLIIGIPVLILTNRAIVTPYKLPYTKPLVACKLLLSPTERRQPWKLYLLPGVFMSQVLGVLLWTTVIPLVTILLRPLTATPLIGVAAVVYFAFALIGATLQTPLLVAQGRLSIQRTQSGLETEETAVAEAEVVAAAGVERFSTEDVITLRDDREQYTGFVNCLNKIIAEEGWRTLFRAWWMTFIGFYFLTMV